MPGHFLAEYFAEALQVFLQVCATFLFLIYCILHVGMPSGVLLTSQLKTTRLGLLLGPITCNLQSPWMSISWTTNARVSLIGWRGQQKMQTASTSVKRPRKRINQESARQSAVANVQYIVDLLSLYVQKPNVAYTVQHVRLTKPSGRTRILRLVALYVDYRSPSLPLALRRFPVFIGPILHLLWLVTVGG